MLDIAQPSPTHQSARILCCVIDRRLRRCREDTGAPEVAAGALALPRGDRTLLAYVASPVVSWRLPRSDAPASRG